MRSAAMILCLACAGVSSIGRTSEIITLPPDRPLAVRDAEDRLLVLNEPRKLYLLDFVAVGCKPCVEELPELERLARELESSGRFQLVTVVYAWSGKSLSTLGTSLQSGTLPLYGDTEGCAQRLDVKGWPTKFLVRDGRVLRRSFGGGAGAYEKWREIIQRELNVEAAE